MRFSDELRKKVEKFTAEMHEYMNKAYTPKVKMKKGCNACSLKDICVPKLNNSISVKDYIDKYTRYGE